ncbi:MAG TPA: hypothetical protein VEI97_06435 [bacterium]|nr:hypothetical protein [bacterium]
MGLHRLLAACTVAMLLAAIGCSSSARQGMRTATRGAANQATGGTDTATQDGMAVPEEDTTTFEDRTGEVNKSATPTQPQERPVSMGEVRVYVEGLLYPGSEPGFGGEMITETSDQVMARTKVNATPAQVRDYLVGKGAKVTSESSQPDGYQATLQLEDAAARVSVVITIDQPGGGMNPSMVNYSAGAYSPVPGGFEGAPGVPRRDGVPGG